MDEHDLPSSPELLAVREASWNAGRSRAALAGVHARVRRARTVRRASGALALCACAALAFALWPRASAPVAMKPAPAPQSSMPHAAPALAPVQDGRVLRFADASTVKLLDDSAEVEVLVATAERVEVALQRGQAAFAVSARPTRVFVVRVASLALEVVGTAYRVEREPTRVLVSVEQGRVQVTGPEERRLLVAKESAWFSLEQAPAGASPRETREPPGHHVARSSTREAFLEHARHQRYANALEVIRERPSVVHDDPEDLMLAADAARLSGHAAEAVPYLQRVAEQHARDARAPLAAFTMGRIYLFELDRPLEARKAFALTRKMSADGALAEDALAREVEAAARAGLASEARKLAQEYLDRYPQGRRRSQVAKVVEPQ